MKEKTSSGELVTLIVFLSVLLAALCAASVWLSITPSGPEQTLSAEAAVPTETAPMETTQVETTVPRETYAATDPIFTTLTTEFTPPKNL